MIRVFPDANAAAIAIAERMARVATSAFQARARFRLGLSGGRSPVPLYTLLATRGPDAGIDWERTEVLFADERAVPPDHPDSNFRLIHGALLEPLRVPERQVRRMKGEADDLDRAAREYETWLEEPIDLLVLGVGPDGHVASIFPNAAVVSDRIRRVVVVENSPKPPPRRLTITPRTIGEAREVAVLVFGDEKAEAAAGALERETPPERNPARLVRDRDWYLDRAAAARLERRNESGASL